ncbi:hypothetical protein SJAV_25620 [Sulfurisphaera javensis]|uniref:Uncharacterized protein n=1 Tax=Sulfurisphaera javensis TaxID=2049879 RepID=A0AAT9GVH4_9CREN
MLSLIFNSSYFIGLFLLILYLLGNELERLYYIKFSGNRLVYIELKFKTYLKRYQGHYNFSFLKIATAIIQYVSPLYSFDISSSGLQQFLTKVISYPFDLRNSKTLVFFG